MQVRFFQLGSGGKTIDGCSEELAVNPTQKAEWSSVQDKSDIIGFVCLGEWEGPTQLVYWGGEHFYLTLEIYGKNYILSKEHFWFLESKSPCLHFQAN